MSFQRCPLCLGIGVERFNECLELPCSVCQGKRIIDEKTGKPPEIGIEKVEVSEAKPEDIVTPLSVLDELSDDEILYYATPYYDELQAQKELRMKQLKEDSNESD